MEVRAVAGWLADMPLVAELVDERLVDRYCWLVDQGRRMRRGVSGGGEEGKGGEGKAMVRRTQVLRGVGEEEVQALLKKGDGFGKEVKGTGGAKATEKEGTDGGSGRGDVVKVEEGVEGKSGVEGGSIGGTAEKNGDGPIGSSGAQEAVVSCSEDVLAQVQVGHPPLVRSSTAY